ncbi:MAG: hypothetical protein FJ118_18430 [Deltaproteobacteria bacterium]|nr:hypothetical protein [Deltaproteobacteria bacterium]MBM4453164.1 hypothetical protein [Chloroflexota bacterium]
MSNWKGFLQRLKEKLFVKKSEKYIATDSPPQQAKTVSVPQVKVGRKSSLEREPYFVQIGFDFGTAYSKCVCRDIITNKAWVYLPAGFERMEHPFLISSVLLIRNGKLSHVENPGADYHANGLYHLKHALEKVALRQWHDPVLDPYRNALGESDVNQLAAFIRNCAVYFLAGAFGEIRGQVRQRFPSFGMRADDYVALNLAVPVADAERPEVNRLYNQVLFGAWVLADELNGHPVVDVVEVERLLTKISEKEVPSVKDACFIYPEASANVQGFVRSRVSSPGIYLFSDTGAGTVDQSVFIFLRDDNCEHLTYLHGNVLPLGSSFIERRAASAFRRTDWEALEAWKQRKESGGVEPPLMEARNAIHEELMRGTEQTLARAKQKLIVKSQLDQIRVIFGGGGHCEYPYKAAVMRPFSGGLFRRVISPDVLGMPVPIDLELEAGQARWMRRLSVAYGLSFERSELATFTYPVELETPRPEEIWRPRRIIQDAPTKDEC